MKTDHLLLFIVIFLIQIEISKAADFHFIQKEKFTGKIDNSREQNYMDSEECLNYPTHYFITNEGENLLVVFLNKTPENGSISIEGFFQEINNVCTKGGSNQLFMVSNFTKAKQESNHTNQPNTKLSDIGSELTPKQAQEALDVHNEARAEVGVPLLTWSVELSQIAQQWADYLAQNGCNMKHSESSETGENLYWTSRGSESTPSDAVRAWYSEKKDFKNVPLKGNAWYETGHYSQMVWKSTTHVGMASAKCSKGETIVVANYSPPGNYMGDKAY
ncbi:CAP family protein [Moheibacter sediminis]|uniref:Uncharacterized conserved protein YkwD, contains CAP (CSP/antigen 5/PR1) domain n=1 Tax=Moheibacter sediminis TaxID=1434700 RepID=A0A1W2B0Y1_9FLAO|nr:CAP family protein [Moheibacter sediminis]SMC66382.1 Uncharacterized conserved protein YkwD, contains CAP (CSP/antigen 5/PR1) domain [Moheibacter sediminis]